MNKFELQFEGGGYSFPCNICKNRISPVQECKKCRFYDIGVSPMDESDLEYDIQRLIDKI